MLRLSSGEDLIAHVTMDPNGDYQVESPMEVHIEHNKQANLVMSHWLPVQVARYNITVIKKQFVLAEFLPNEEFSEYYENTVRKVQDVLKAKELADSLSDEELEEIMYAMEDKDNQIIH